MGGKGSRRRKGVGVRRALCGTGYNEWCEMQMVKGFDKWDRTMLRFVNDIFCKWRMPFVGAEQARIWITAGVY